MEEKKQFLTMKYHYKCNKKTAMLLRFLCKVSNLVYNHALFELRKMYYETNEICSYFDLNKVMMTYEASHTINTYQTLCVDRCAHDNMKKYVTGIKKAEYLKNTYGKGSYKNQKYVMLPKYRRKQSFYPLITDEIRPLWYKNRMYFKLPLSNPLRTGKIFDSAETIKDYKLKKLIERFDKNSITKVYIKIPKELYEKEIKQIRIVPDKYGNHFFIEFSYITDAIVTDINEEGCAMGIDIGINNLAACVTTDNDYFLIDGRKIKSINQYFNKRKAMLYSELPEGIHTSKAIRRLYFRRNNIVDDYINKSVSILMKKIKEMKVTEVIIGWNNGLKMKGIKNTILKVKKKRKVNQSFTEIPLSKFKNKLIAKCKMNNIKITEINESYTSRCSFADNEEIKKHDSYIGKRIARSTFITGTKTKVHADINAACNILSKSISKDLSEMRNLMSRGLTIPYRVYVSASP